MVIDILSISVERERQRRAKSPSWDPRDDDERCESVWNSVSYRGAFLTDETRDNRSGDFWTWDRRSRWSRRSDDSLFCFRGSDLSGAESSFRIIMRMTMRFQRCTEQSRASRASESFLRIAEDVRSMSAEFSVFTSRAPNGAASWLESIGIRRVFIASDENIPSEVFTGSRDVLQVLRRFARETRF